MIVEEKYYLSQEAKKVIIMEVKQELSRGFEILQFEGGQTFPPYPYYLYFGDSDEELRRYAIAIFTIRLGYWESGCSFPFYKQSVLYKYIKALLNYQDEIEKNYPIFFVFIIHFLEELTENYKFTEDTRIKSYIHEIIQKDFLTKKRGFLEKNIELLKTDYFIKELKIQD